MANNPIRHHFIPQFILRNFVDEKGYLNYFNKEKNVVEYVLPKDVFARKDLYRDEKNHPALPVEIECELSRFESEVAPIINKLLTGDIVILSKEEEEKLKLFIFTMDFRSERAMKNFVKNVTPSSKKSYSEYQTDGDMESYWKRNLSELAKCRSFKEVYNSKRIDKYVQFYVFQGVGDHYLMIYRKKGKDNFVLSDKYPVVELFTNPLGIKFYNFYLPLSPDKVLIMVNNIIQKDIKGELIPSGDFLFKPDSEGDNFIYTVGKTFKKFVKALNNVSIKDCKRGYVFK